MPSEQGELRVADYDMISYMTCKHTWHLLCIIIRLFKYWVKLMFLQGHIAG